MKTAGRVVLVLLVVVQGWSAYRLSIHGSRFVAGVRAYESGRYDDALRSFDGARSAWGGDSETHAWVGDAALALYDRTIAAAPAAIEGATLLDRAWAGYAGAVLRSPMDAWSWSGLAQVALRRAAGEDRRAGVDLDELDKRAGGVLDAWRAAAMSAARLSVELKPSGYQELDVLADVFAAVGRPDRAATLYARSAKMMPAPSFHEWGSGRRMPRPLYEAVIAALREGVDRAPVFDVGLMRIEIGRFAASQGDLNASLDVLEKARASATDTFQRYQAESALAGTFASLGRDDDALAALERAKTTGYDPDVVGQRMGEILVKMGRFDAACAELGQALRHRPTEVPLRVAAAHACESGGKGDEAVRLLQEGMGSTPDDETIARALVEMELRLGRLGSVRSQLELWVRDAPDHPVFATWLEAVKTGKPLP